MHSLISMSGVTFEYPNGLCLFDNVHLSIKQNLTALIGPNGFGKSTLAKLIAGELGPSSGRIEKSASVHFFAQKADPTTVSVHDFLAENYEFSLEGEKLLEPLDRDLSCSSLSGGQWMRLRLACAFHRGFLILDEPTNDLDRQGREALFEFLRNQNQGCLIISHDRECLQLCSEFIELSTQGVAKFTGSWNAFEKSKKLENENLEANLERAKRERKQATIDREEKREAQARRSRQGSKQAERGGRPRIMIGIRKRRAEETSGRIDAETSLAASHAVTKAFEAFAQQKLDPTMTLRLIEGSIAPQKLIAEAFEFNIRFNDWLYKNDLTLSWRGPIRIALKGRNGSGKSSLLNAILGRPLNNSATRGEFRTGDLRVLYVDQKHAQLNDDESLLENIRGATHLSETEIRNGLARFLFQREAVFKKARDLSGGERLRAVLAQSFLKNSKPELLVLDEPTNNLDLANIEFLETIVREFRGAVIVISHDDVFLERCELDTEFVLSS